MLRTPLTEAAGRRGHFIVTHHYPREAMPKIQFESWYAVHKVPGVITVQCFDHFMCRTLSHADPTWWGAQKCTPRMHSAAAPTDPHHGLVIIPRPCNPSQLNQPLAIICIHLAD